MSLRKINVMCSLHCGIAFFPLSPLPKNLTAVFHVEMSQVFLYPLSFGLNKSFFSQPYLVYT